MDDILCGRLVNGRLCLREPDHRPDRCSPLLFPHEVEFWPGLVHSGVTTPPWPPLDDPPIDVAREVAEELSAWRQLVRWSATQAGLRLGIVADLSRHDDRAAARHTASGSGSGPGRGPGFPIEFVTQVAWLLVTAAHDSVSDAAHTSGPVFTCVVLAADHPSSPRSSSTQPRASAGTPNRPQPGLDGVVGHGLTPHRGIAAAADTVGLTDPPAARLLVVISDAGHPPDELARVQRQISTLRDRGCGMLWLRPAAGSSGRADTPPDVLRLDPAAPVPGVALAAAALDALHRGDRFGRP